MGLRLVFRPSSFVLRRSSFVVRPLWYTDSAMATKTPTGAELPPQDAADGNTGRIELVAKPGNDKDAALLEAAQEVTPQGEDTTHEASTETEVLQETKP